jgi:hypothetical protein
MKRTEAEKIAAAAFVQMDILLNNRDQFAARFDFFNNLFRNQVADGAPPLLESVRSPAIYFDIDKIALSFYSNWLPLINSWNWRPRNAAAFRHIFMRIRKISK